MSLYTYVYISLPPSLPPSLLLPLPLSSFDTCRMSAYCAFSLSETLDAVTMSDCRCRVFMGVRITDQGWIELCRKWPSQFKIKSRDQIVMQWNGIESFIFPIPPRSVSFGVRAYPIQENYLQLRKEARATQVLRHIKQVSSENLNPQP